MLIIGINAKSNGSVCILTDGGNVLSEFQLPIVRIGKYFGDYFRPYLTVDEKKLQERLAQAFTHIDWPVVVNVQAYVGYPPLVPSEFDLYRALMIGKILGVLASFPASVTHMETNDTAHEIALRGLKINAEGLANAG